MFVEMFSKKVAIALKSHVLNVYSVHVVLLSVSKVYKRVQSENGIPWLPNALNTIETIEDTTYHNICRCGESV